MAVGDNGHTGIPMTTELDTMVTIIQATTREATPVTTLGKINAADLIIDDYSSLWARWDSYAENLHQYKTRLELARITHAMLDYPCVVLHWWKFSTQFSRLAQIEL